MATPIHEKGQFAWRGICTWKFGLWIVALVSAVLAAERLRNPLAVVGITTGLRWLHCKEGKFWYCQAAHCALWYTAFQSQFWLISCVLSSSVLFLQYDLPQCESSLTRLLLCLKQSFFWLLTAVPVCLDLYFYAGICGLALFLSCKEAESGNDQCEEELLRQAASDGMAAVTAEGRVIVFNQKLVDMMEVKDGCITKEGVAQALREAKMVEESGKSGTLLDNILGAFCVPSPQVPLELGTVFVSSRYLECRGSLVSISLAPAFILSIRDISLCYSLAAKAKKENEDKSAMLRSVAHELRTPLNAIINLAQETMDVGSISVKGTDNCKMMLSSAYFLLSTVNDLLDFARIASSNFKLTKQVYHLKDTLRSCLSLIEPQCRLKKIDLKLRYDSLLPELVYNDPNRLKQVVLNLLSNALKFTLKGSIEVVAVLVSKVSMRISVTDTGIGIPKDSQQKIFSLFGKLDGNEKLNPQGCGLGLPISNSIVQGMGGDGIHIESCPGQGSTFSFEMQLNSETPLVSLILPAESTEYTLDIDEHTPKVDLPETFDLWKDPIQYADILVVDDSEFNRVVLSTMLGGLSMDCDEAFTGADAVRKVLERNDAGYPYSLIFMDVEMPDMTGIEATSKLRQLFDERKVEKLPIIVGCSAYVSDEDRSKCLSSGMDFFLEKPLSKQHLINLISKLDFL